MSKWQDITISDANLKAEFITRFFNGDYISAFRIIEDNPQLNTKAFLANVMNEISNLLSLLQNNFQSNVIDYLANELDGFNHLINEFNLKGSWNSETTYEIYNFVVYNNIDYLYINPTPSAGNLPTNTTYWLEINIRGATGAPGLGVNLKYDWDSSIEYQPLDVVYYNNALWVATITNINKRPDNYEAWQTLVGEVVTFTSNNDLKFKSISANFSPIQDLNGQEAPWPAGGGKNKYPILVGNDVWVDNNGGTHSTGSDGSLVIVTSASKASSGVYLNTATATMTSVLSSFGDNPRTISMDIVASASGKVRLTSGNSVTVEVGTTKQRVSVVSTNTGCSIYGVNNGATLTISNVQIESGSTATAFAPYSNICPISGHTDCDIFDKAEYDAQATPTVTISFGTTVYGGKLTVNGDGSGQIEATYYGHIFDGTETVSAISSGDNRFIRYAIDVSVNINGRMCSHFPNATITTSNTEQGFYCYTSGVNSYMQFRWSDLFTTSQGFKDWCAAQYAADTPLVAVGVINSSAHFTIPLTASQINTLVGENVVWVNGSSGDITVELEKKYWETFLPFKLIKIYSNTTAPTGDDLYTGVIWFEMLTS